MLQAVKFTHKKVPGLHLDLDEDLQAAGCSRKSFVAIRWVVEAMKASDGKTLGGHDLTAALSVACSNQLKQYRWKPIQGIEEAFRFRVANVSAGRIRRA